MAVALSMADCIQEVVWRTLSSSVLTFLLESFICVV